MVSKAARSRTRPSIKKKRGTATSEPITAWIKWISGNSERLGKIKGVWFDEREVLRIEIDCDYIDVSHYSLVFGRQNLSHPAEYFGEWSSDDQCRSRGMVDVRLTEAGKGVFQLAGTWTEGGETWDWETTSAVAIPKRS
jgi:hypothetical protein